VAYGRLSLNRLCGLLASQWMTLSMPWFINNTAQLVCMVAAFSHSGMPQADFDAGGGFEALVEKLYDFE
jgi:hypothetical protein